jgi:hypothetical protein
MEHFRRLGLPGDYFLEFELQVLPRRGETRYVPGRMWGSRNDIGPIFRAALFDDTMQAETQLLGQNGYDPQAWRVRGHTTIEHLQAANVLDSVADTGITMFELQMPFIYWEDYVYEGVTKVRGRAVHAFLMYPPEDFAAANPQIAGVRLHLDAQFNALMQAVILNAEEEPQRKLTVLDLKKLDEQWIVKSIDVRDEATRDKVRFEVTGAALNLDFSRALFAPANLVQLPEPPIGVTRF